MTTKKRSVKPSAHGSDFASKWSRLKGVVRRITPQRVKDFYRIFVPRSMKEAFTDVYGCDVWSGGSGRDSTPENTAMYRNMIEEFLRTVWCKYSNEPYDIVIRKYYGKSLRAMTHVIQSSFCQPVFDTQARHTRELPDIGGHHG
jgi:hypothetical protein